MRRPRFLLAAIVVAMVTVAQVPVGNASAATVQHPATDFTLVTPATTLLFATIQSTSARQTRLLGENAGRIADLPVVQSVLGGLAGGAAGMPGSGGSNMQQALPLVATALGSIFNGELGLAVLPPSTSTGQGPSLHLLLDAGLRPGITAATLRFTVALAGVPVTPQPGYRGVSIVGVDLNALVRSIARITNNASLAAARPIPANGPLSSVFYGAVVGNDAVLASDLPSLHAALDTYSRARPSIADTEAFAAANGLLPQERFATLYLNGGGLLLGIAAGALGGAVPLGPISAGGVASALTANATSLTLTSSTPPTTRSTVIPLP